MGQMLTNEAYLEAFKAVANDDDVMSDIVQELLDFVYDNLSQSNPLRKDLLSF